MANSWYNEGLEYYLEGGAGFSADGALKVALMDGTFTVSAGATGWASLVAKQVGSSVVLGTKSSTGGQMTGGDVTFAGIGAGLTIGGVVLYHETGVGTGTLIAGWDVGTGLPLTTTGANIIVHWSGTTPTGVMGQL